MATHEASHAWATVFEQSFAAALKQAGKHQMDMEVIFMAHLRRFRPDVDASLAQKSNRRRPHYHLIPGIIQAMQQAEAAAVMFSHDGTASPHVLADLECTLAAVGRRHQLYGVTASGFTAVGDAMLATLQEVLGADWCAGSAPAEWRAAFQRLTRMMLAGYVSMPPEAVTVAAQIPPRLAASRSPITALTIVPFSGARSPTSAPLSSIPPASTPSAAAAAVGARALSGPAAAAAFAGSFGMQPSQSSLLDCHSGQHFSSPLHDCPSGQHYSEPPTPSGALPTAAENLNFTFNTGAPQVTIRLTKHMSAPVLGRSAGAAVAWRRDGGALMRDWSWQDEAADNFFFIKRQPMFGELFYAKLFEAHPELKPLFNTVDMASQYTKLLRSLALCVEGLRDPTALRPSLLELGRRHVAYGAQEGQVAHVGEALLKTLEHLNGDAWSPSIRDGWIKAIHAVTSIMIEGLRSITVPTSPVRKKVALLRFWDEAAAAAAATKSMSASEAYWDDDCGKPAEPLLWQAWHGVVYAWAMVGCFTRRSLSAVPLTVYTIIAATLILLEGALVQRLNVWNNITNLLGYTEEVAILLTVAIWYREEEMRGRAYIFGLWNAIDSSKGTVKSRPRINALQELNQLGVAIDDMVFDTYMLRGIDMWGAVMLRCSLRHADCFQSTFAHANLGRADLRGADFSASNLSWATLSFANFTGARLCGADLTGARLICADFTDANLSAANLTGARMGSAIFKGFPCGSQTGGHRPQSRGSHCKWLHHSRGHIRRLRHLPP